MKFRIASDLHCEFGTYCLPSLPDDKSTILLLAGDILSFAASQMGCTFKWLETVCAQFYHVVYVPGNHELYGISLPQFRNIISVGYLSQFTNLTILDNSSVSFDNVSIVGATLWTDFDKNNPLVIQDAQSINGIKDFTYIDGMSPRIMYQEHLISKTYLASEIDRLVKSGQQVIAMSHHAPTWASIISDYVGNGLNGAYASDLSELILDTNPILWIHGHIHDSVDYMCGDTRIICNPRGYPQGPINRAFIDDLVIVL